MGIEPTGPGSHRGPTGFEDQARHQTRSASNRVIIAKRQRAAAKPGASDQPTQSRERSATPAGFRYDAKNASLNRRWGRAPARLCNCLTTPRLFLRPIT